MAAQPPTVADIHALITVLQAQVAALQAATWRPKWRNFEREL